MKYFSVFLVVGLLMATGPVAWAQSNKIEPGTVEYELGYLKERIRNLEDKVRFQEEKIRMLERRVEDNDKRLDRRSRYAT